MSGSATLPTRGPGGPSYGCGCVGFLRCPGSRRCRCGPMITDATRCQHTCASCQQVAQMHHLQRIFKAYMLVFAALGAAAVRLVHVCAVSVVRGVLWGIKYAKQARTQLVCLKQSQHQTAAHVTWHLQAAMRPATRPIHPMPCSAAACYLASCSEQPCLVYVCEHLAVRFLRSIKCLLYMLVQLTA